MGQTLYLNREPYTVIGVLSRQYFYTGPEILVPIHLTFDPNFAWNVQARLKRGVNPRMAEQRLQPLFDQFVVGLYSVVSYSVSCRFKEFGIRMVLGASRGRIVNAAMQPAVLAIVAGLCAGLALSVGLNKVVARWSIGNLNDPVVLVAVSLVLFVVTMMSTAIPANRAASIQPVDALRID